MRSTVYKRRLDLAHPVVQRKNLFVQFLQIRNLCLKAHVFPRFGDGITAFGNRLLRQPHRLSGLTRRSYTGSRTGSTQHFFYGHAFYIGIASLVAC